MLLDLSSIVSALGLVSSIVKPLPVVGGIVGGVLDTADGVLGSAVGTVQSTVNGLLPGILAEGIGSTTASATATAGLGAATDIPSAVANLSCPFEPYLPGDLVVEPFAAYDPAKAVIYRYRQQQSVNLGSWFVQEQWMNPSLFTCAAGPAQAELDVASGWGGIANAKQVLERHWDEWITESDFAYLASIGINTVRLPIGYWSLGPIYCMNTPFEPYSAVYINSWARIVRAINWADKYGLGVLVDLHGAPGSQNAHSGVSDGQVNFFNNATNIQLTINVLTYLSQQLVNVNNIVGIELLNEPNNDPTLPAFYDQALSTLRQVSPEAEYFPFYIHDAFNLDQYAQYIANRTDFVVLDHHSYFVFGDAASQEIAASVLASEMTPAQGSISEQLLSAAALERRNLVVDEYSCALSNDALANSTDPSRDRREYCTGQMESYANATAGWAFWSYKTESCSTDDNWCFTHAVGNSLPSTFYSYPNATIAAINSSSTDTSLLMLGTPSDAGSDTSVAMLTALGSSAQLSVMNEALASTEYDSGSTGMKRRSLPQRAFALSSALLEHRFAARAERASKRDTTAVTYSPEQVAISRGYEDGLKAAQTFAANSGSRLGQFMDDAITALGSAISVANQPYYKSWFMKGLVDGELEVMQQMAQSS